MVSFYDCFVIPDCNTRNANVSDVVREWNGVFCFFPFSNLLFFVEHINHIRKVAGVDHIGIGGDFNGVSKYVEALKIMFNLARY